MFQEKERIVYFLKSGAITVLTDTNADDNSKLTLIIRYKIKLEIWFLRVYFVQK